MISSPQELYEYMSDIEYAWMDQQGKFHTEMVPEIYENYSAMSPEEVKKYRKGICMDQSEFARDWFEKNNYEVKLMVIQIERDDSAPGHQFLIYKDNNKYYWFEHAWFNEKGIHEYNSYEELIEDIKNKFIKQNDVTEQELCDVEIFEQVKYPYHINYAQLDNLIYREQLKEILNQIEEKHIDMYFNISKKELNEYIEETLKKYELKSKYDLYYISNVIIKKIFGRYDSHTRIVWNNADFNLPIRIKYINNKLYIIRTDEKNKDLLYGQILKINNIEIEKLIEEIKEMNAYSTEGYLQMMIETILFNGRKIKSLPSIETDIKEFEYEILKDDKIIKRKLKKQEEDLIKVNIKKDNYTHEIIDDTVYIVYNACKENYPGQMNDLIEELKRDEKEKYIIDLRGNTGGNSNYLKPLIEFLKDKKVVTIVDQYVFSGGRWAVIDLKNIGSKIIGTEIGTTLNCFGNTPRTNLGKFFLTASEKYFYYDEKDSKIKGIESKEEFEKFKNNPDNNKFFEPQVFKPDYYVENTIEDYKYGYDRQLDSAQLLINTRMKEDRKEQLELVTNPDELMNYLDNNMVYGWIDKEGQKYINNLKNVRKNYRTSTIDEIIESGVVTCAEDAKLIKYELEKMGYETKLYCHRTYETDDNFEERVKMHCFVLFKDNDNWYHFEHSMTPIKGIHKYDSIEDALKWITSKWNKGERQLAEIEEIPDHLTYKELNQYVNKFDQELNKQRIR